MNTTSNAAPISVPALLALALKAARSAPGLDDAMHAYGSGDYLEAESQLLVAGHAGHPNAQELLGFMYAIGPDLYPGIWRSLTAAKNWFERAARAGRPAAQYMHVAFTRRGTLEVRAEIIASFDPAAARSGGALVQASASDPGRSAPPGEE
jgi:TPR repeat protein